MKEYGALRNAFQFQYHDSPVHRLGGGWKIIFALGFSAAAVAARGPWTIAGLWLPSSVSTELRGLD